MTIPIVYFMTCIIIKMIMAHYCMCIILLGGIHYGSVQHCGCLNNSETSVLPLLVYTEFWWLACLLMTGHIAGPPSPLLILLLHHPPLAPALRHPLQMQKNHPHCKSGVRASQSAALFHPGVERSRKPTLSLRSASTLSYKLSQAFFLLWSINAGLYSYTYIFPSLDLYICEVEFVCSYPPMLII